MQILVHLGFNKCASSYIQHALAGSQSALRRRGVFYAVEGERAAQYGLSRYYGFGPDAEGVTRRSLGWLAARARERGCGRMIVSSEYLSLGQPDAIATFMEDLRGLGAEAQFLVFSRDLGPWLSSLFNQYVKTVDGGPFYDSIDSFVSHVLRNGSIDLARRYRVWVDAAGPDWVTHVRIAENQADTSVLAPFEAFAGVPVAPAMGPVNHSLPAGALYLTGRLRQAHRGPLRDRLLTRIAAGGCDWAMAPEGYLRISAQNMARLEREIAEPFARIADAIASGHAA
ncbi:MAG: hypothetical protein OEN23_16175 [Paracoccaceae bacterium]|nr:hypothetical protein [Paracoccaceae bacterium]